MARPGFYYARRLDRALLVFARSRRPSAGCRLIGCEGVACNDAFAKDRRGERTHHETTRRIESHRELPRVVEGRVRLLVVIGEGINRRADHAGSVVVSPWRGVRRR